MSDQVGVEFYVDTLKSICRRLKRANRGIMTTESRVEIAKTLGEVKILLIILMKMRSKITIDLNASLSDSDDDEC